MTAAEICSDCGTGLRPSTRRKGTRCKSCATRAIMRDPATRAKVSAAMRRKWADPEQRAARVAIMTEVNRRPEMIAQRRALGKALNNITRFARPLPAGHPARVQAGRTLTERRLAWCPPGYRPDYARLKEIDGFRAKDARAIIEGQIAADLAAMRKGTLPPGRLIMVREAARWIRERAAVSASEWAGR